jgi:PPP family 3-phenylpropionic acid transporter
MLTPMRTHEARLGGAKDRRVARAPDVRALFALGGAATGAILPFFALWLASRGLSPSRIGVVLAVSALAGILAAPVWSHLADTRIGTVRALAAAAAGSAAAGLLMLAVGPSYLPIVAVAVLLGVAQSPGPAFADTLALGTLGEGRLSEYGSVRVWTSIGWAVAVVAFGALFERVGLWLMMPAFAAATVLYVALALRFPRTVPPPRTAGSRLGSVGDAVRESPRLLPFLLGVLLVSTATQGAWSFVPLRIASFGGGPLIVGIAAGLAAVVEVPFLSASAWLGRRVSLRSLYVGGAMIYVASMLAWSVLSTAVAVAVVKIAAGAGFGLVYASLVVITGRLVPRRLRNTGQTLMQTASMSIAPVVGAAVGGLVYQGLGPAALFVGAAACAALGAAVVWFSLAGDAVAGVP